MVAGVALAACATKWQAQTAPPADVLRFNGDGDYLVTSTRGLRFELRNPVIERDSLVGIEKPGPTGPDLKARRAIALSDVKQIATREPDEVATVGWVSLAGVFVVFVSFLVFLGRGLSD
jgi:hypothetical protein